MYHTILIPIENSPADRTILDHVKLLAHTLKSRIILIHVADGFAARHQDDLNLADSEEMRVDRAYLERCREEFLKDGLEASAILACGEPAEEILKACDREQCDLIAMSTHGHRFVKDVVLGSVASAVRHRTNIPVLMVKARAAS